MEEEVPKHGCGADERGYIVCWCKIETSYSEMTLAEAEQKPAVYQPIKKYLTSPMTTFVKCYFKNVLLGC